MTGEFQEFENKAQSVCSERPNIKSDFTEVVCTWANFHQNLIQGDRKEFRLIKRVRVGSFKMEDMLQYHYFQDISVK